MSPPVDVHFVAAGPPDADLVVFSHSLGAALATWEPQAAALAARFRVVRYDLRGHGRSPVPPGPYEIADLGGDLLALLDRLGARRAHLVGLSLGAMTSLWVAAHHPERVDRLMVCCTSALLGPPEGWHDRAALVESQGTAAVAETVIARWFTPAFRARSAGRVAEIQALIAATPAAGYAACARAIARMDLRQDLRRIRAPTLAVAGAQDPSTTPEHLARIAAAVPDCRLEIVDQAAHLANVEQPAAVTALIVDHLDHLSAQGGASP